MAKLDRLGWAAGVCFQSYGWRIGVRVSQDDPAVLERVRACLPPGWSKAEPPFVDVLYSLRVGGAGPRANVRNYHLLHGGMKQAARSMVLEQVFETLENELQMFVAEWAKERVFVHAGVVGWRGRAIVLPGRSYSGKSTLVQALLAAGATYYSDEYAVLDGEGRVHPYARRLSLRQPEGGLRRVAAEELGAAVGQAPLPVGLVALSRFRPGAAWQPRPLSPGKAMLELLDNTVPARSRSDLAVKTLAQVVPQSGHLKGSRGEAEQAAELLLRAVEQLPAVA